jgi:hypothetical protein
MILLGTVVLKLLEKFADADHADDGIRALERIEDLWQTRSANESKNS